MTNIIEVSFPNHFDTYRCDQDYSQRKVNDAKELMDTMPKTGLRYFPKSNTYKNTTGSNVYNPETMRAYSYDWYCYFKTYNLDGDDIYLLNTYYYSPSTAKHIRDFKELLWELGHHDILDTLTEIEAPNGLDNLDMAIKAHEEMIDELQEAIDKPRTRAAKNDERRDEIKKHKAKIKVIELAMKGE